MKKRLKIVILFVLCIINYNTITYANTNVNTSLEEGNPYIEQYNYDNNNQLENYDGNEEEVNTLIDTLNDYYNKDVEVANILSLHFNESNLLEKTISLEKEDKIEIMNKIKDFYYDLSDEDEKEILVGYFERYAKSSGDEELYDFLKMIYRGKSTTEIGLMKSSQIVYRYNGDAAAAWAYNNYNKYSTDFPQFTGSYGSNCTNFVSQAMHRGGSMPMAGNWYSYKKNSTYLVPNSTYELNYSWTLSDPSPWISVKEFNNFWEEWNPLSRSDTYNYSVTNYKQQHNSIYYYNIVKGDIVIFNQGMSGWIELPTHAMIISGYDSTNKDFLMAGQSQERQAYPLLDLISKYASITIHHITTSSGEWVYNNPNYYWYENEVMVKSAWRNINGGWYYLKSDGIMAKGWLQINGYWYYLDPTYGYMRTDWQKIDGKWYYFWGNGSMAKGWINPDGYWYYLDLTNGDMITGWKGIDNKWYYFYNDGKMATNTVIDGWRIDSNGVATQL